MAMGWGTNEGGGNAECNQCGDPNRTCADGCGNGPRYSRTNNGQDDKSRKGKRRYQPEIIEHLSSHSVCFVAIDCSDSVKQLKHNGKTDRYFGASHHQNKDEHDLSVSLSPLRASRDKGEPGSIQHDFDRQQDEDDIAPRQHAGEPYGEEQ